MICEKPINRGPNKGQPATGTDTGYKRHRAHGQQPCKACAEAHREYVNGQYVSRKPMVCASPLTRGPMKGQSATGTNAGYQRHRAIGEQPCDDCQAGRAVAHLEAYHRVKKKQLAEKRRKAAEERRRLQGLAEKRPPLPCAICGELVRDHAVGEWCRPTLLEEKVG